MTTDDPASMTPTLRIGIDLGGTKIAGIALGADGAVLAHRRAPTPRGDYACTVEAVAGLVEGLEREIGQPGTVGVGMPGAISPATGLVKNANSTWLIGRPLQQDLERRLARPVRLANDANCFALSEAVDGAGAGRRVVFGVILGTGVGGGVVIDGRAWTGPNAIAGEWGHNALPRPEPSEWPGPSCYCGRTGCIETFLSGPGLARDFRAAGGADLTAEEVVRRAATGDVLAVATLQRYVGRLARALSSVINILDPDVIVLGGGLSRLGALYEQVPRLWTRWTFSDRVDTELAAPMHGDAGGARGAAWLWRSASAQPRPAAAPVRNSGLV